MQPAAPENPLLVYGIALLALGPLAWMARAWIREWQDYRAGTLTPHHRDRPPPPTLHQSWRWRMLLVYGTQAVVIGGLTFGMVHDLGSRQAIGLLAINIILVAFATALLTRLWDLSRGALARRRSAGRQGQ